MVPSREKYHTEARKDREALKIAREISGRSDKYPPSKGKIASPGPSAVLFPESTSTAV
jgi:hypothetical protein